MSYHRYGVLKEPVTPNNVCHLQPDGYQILPDRVTPFNWMGDVDKCGEEYQDLKKAIGDNGDTAVGLFTEVAATPSKVQVSGLWFENMRAVAGLKIKLELYDICGEVIEELPFDNIDLGINPCCGTDECAGGCPTGGDDTFCKYNIDTSESNGCIGRGNSAILRLTIIEEPEGGLLGSDCSSGTLPMFSGGLIYKSFCNQRNILSIDGEDFSCLDGAPDSIVECWNESERKAEVGG